MMATAGFEVGTRWRLAEPPGGTRRAEGGRRCTQPAALEPPGPPLVSYVTVVRNAAATLSRMLASVRIQRDAAVEHIVIDGLSDDGTLTLIQDHAAQIDYFVSEPDGGLYEALNKALSLVRGRLVCVLNADDWLTRDAAARALAALQRCAAHENDPARLILTAAWQHNGSRRRLWLPGVLDTGSWLRCPNVCHNGVYATPAALRAAGPYDTRLRIVADSRWLLAAVDAGVPIHTVHAPTVHYVTGGLSGDVTRHVGECARMLALGFPALDDNEIWALLHAFYPWAGNLQRFAGRCPPHLGKALQALSSRHAGDAKLQACLQAAGWERQRGHARRVAFRRPLAADLQRGWSRLRYTVADALGGGRRDSIA